MIHQLAASSFRKPTSIACALITTLSLTKCQTDTTPMRSTMDYPQTRTENVKDTLWGVEVADPYRWLENDRSAETIAWVDEQIEFTQEYLNNLAWRQPLRDRFEALYNYEKIGMPRKIGDRYFLSKNDGLQNQSVWYVREALDGEDKLFLDPNALSEDGTVTASLGSASDDDRYIAVIQNEAGSDWQEIHVYDLSTGEPQGDVLRWVKFSGTSWVGNGFYYSRYPTPEGSELSAENTHHSVYYHEVGTDQSKDRLIYRNDKEPNRYHFAYATEDKQYLILNSSTGTDGNSLDFLDLTNPNATWQKLIRGFNTRSSVVDHHNGRFLVLTDIDAPTYRLVGISALNTSDWIELIPASEHLLEGVRSTGGQLFATYLKNACNAIVRLDMDGSNPRKIDLPNEAGSAGGFGGKINATETFYAFTSFTYPTSIYKYDIATGESTLFASPDVDFNPEDFESKQVWYESMDGTKVPMFIVHKKGLELDGSRPTYLYAYGGFNISLTPSFSSSLLMLLENDGVYAMPNLRGGGEFGEKWHEAGMLLQKQNVFDDFIAAGEYLINEGYTQSNRLAIAGGSNGGLLVGAVMTQRPNLAGVAFPAVGVMDMLRYHQFTIGWGWIPEYGCADSSKADFDNLAGYSPYHNLAPKTAYPATMVTTADHDDRVVPAHSFKFTARLQACQSGGRPALIRIDKNAGHGAGKPTSKILDEQADKWAFMFHEMNIPLPTQ